MKAARRMLLAVLSLAWGAVGISASVSAAPEATGPASAGGKSPTKRPSAEPMSRSRETPSKSQPRKEKPRDEPRQAQRAPAQPPAVGTWRGTISQGIWGNVEVTLVVSPDMGTITSSSRLGRGTHPVVFDGTRLTFRSGLLNEIQWTLAPASDGRSAAVTSRSALGVNGAAVFEKISSSAMAVGGSRSTTRQPGTVPKQSTREKSSGRPRK